MMHIVILGAGDIGVHLASFLSKRDYSVTLLDRRQEPLSDASHQMDIATLRGEGTRWEVLQELLAEGENLFLAMTDCDEVNLVAAALAKRVGYEGSLARIRNEDYLSREEGMDFRAIFSVDYLIGQEISIAYDMQQHILANEARDVRSFVYGRVQMRSLTLSPAWKGENIPLRELDLPSGVKVSLIRRPMGESEEVQYIFPHGEDRLLIGDEVTLIGRTRVILEIHRFFSLPQKSAQSVLIVGGSLVARHLCRLLLRQGISVKIIERQYVHASFLSEEFPDAQIIHGDGTDEETLREEGIDQVDILVCSMRSDAKNILTATLGKKLSVREVVVTLSRYEYASLLHKQEIQHILSPRNSVADQILSIVRGKKIASVASLYGDHAEVLEVKLSSCSPLLDIPLKILGREFPEQFLIGAIHSSTGKVFIPSGADRMQKGDRVILFTHSTHIPFIREKF